MDASQAGEGNLEITISARGRNIPTKVHPQGSARFAVSFVPLEAIDHVITITFNKEAVPGMLILSQPLVLQKKLNNYTFSFADRITF